MTTSRKLSTPELLYGVAQQMGLQPSWVVPNGLFVVVTAQGEKYVNYSASNLNSHVGVSLAGNKYITRVVLDRHDLPNIPFARPKTETEAEAFLEKHKTIIVKPVKGAGSHNIHIVSSMSELAGIDIKECIFEKYISGTEMRYLVLSDQVIAVHESEYGVSVAEDRPLRRISYSQNDWDPILVTISLRIAKILELKFAAVDYLVDCEGRVYVLEVNSNPGLKWFHAPTSGPSVDVASLFLQAMLADIPKQLK